MTVHLFFVLILTLVSLPALTAVVPEGQGPAPPVPLPMSPLPAGKPDIPPSPPIAVSRGRMLYENHCMRCHVSVLHVRENRRAVSLKELEAWVRHWSEEEKLDWNEEEIVEVVGYLNRQFYRFPPPGGKK